MMSPSKSIPSLSRQKCWPFPRGSRGGGWHGRNMLRNTVFSRSRAADSCLQTNHQPVSNVLRVGGCQTSGTSDRPESGMCDFSEVWLRPSHSKFSDISLQIQYRKVANTHNINTNSKFFKEYVYITVCQARWVKTQINFPLKNKNG